MSNENETKPLQQSSVMYRLRDLPQGTKFYADGKIWEKVGIGGRITTLVYRKGKPYTETKDIYDQFDSNIMVQVVANE